MMRATTLFLFSFGLLVTTSAFAQTQEQQDRTNQIARFVVTSPMCGRLGMKLNPDLPKKAEEAFKKEAERWALDNAVFEKLVGEAISRQSAIIEADLSATAAAAQTDSQLRRIPDVLFGYGRICLSATSDPIFAPLIGLPPRYDLKNEVTKASDTMLEAGGLASWQTPSIRLRGQLMMLAGTCRSKIGALRSDKLFEEFGRSDDIRSRKYYMKSFDDGLEDQSLISSLEGCNIAIKKFQSQLKVFAGH